MKKTLSNSDKLDFPQLARSQVMVRRTHSIILMPSIWKKI